MRAMMRLIPNWSLLTVAFLMAIPHVFLGLKIAQVYAERNSTSSLLQLERHIDLWGYGILRRVDDFTWWLLVAIALSGLHIHRVFRECHFAGARPNEFGVARPIGIFVVGVLTFALIGGLYWVKDRDTSLTYGLRHWYKNIAHVPGNIEQTLVQHSGANPREEDAAVADQVLQRLLVLLASTGDVSSGTVAPSLVVEAQECECYPDPLSYRDDFVTARDAMRAHGRDPTSSLTMRDVAYLFYPGTSDDPLIHDRRSTLIAGLQQHQELLSIVEVCREHIRCLISHDEVGYAFAHWSTPQHFAQWQSSITRIEWIQSVEWALLHSTITIWVIMIGVLCGRIIHNPSIAVEHCDRIGRAAFSIVWLYFVLFSIYVVFAGTLELTGALDPLKNWLRNAIQDIAGYRVEDVRRGGRVFLGQMALYNLPCLLLLIVLHCNAKTAVHHRVVFRKEQFPWLRLETTPENVTEA